MEKLKQFVESKVFQNTILGIIIFNAIIMGLQTSTIIMGQVGGILSVLDKVCLGIFVIELILKIIVYNKHFLKDGWNIFDFFIVAISIMPNMGMFSVFRIFRILRVLRSLKALRTLKLVSGLEHLRVIVMAIIKSIPGVFWTLILLLLIYYIYAILGVTLFGATFVDWFGTLGKALYTLFQVMTMESWSMGISRPVMEVFPYAWIYFVSFVLISAFIVMNVVVGIVVNAISEVAEADRKEDIAEKSGNLNAEFEKLKEQLSVVEAIISSQEKSSDSK